MRVYMRWPDGGAANISAKSWSAMFYTHGLRNWYE